MATDTPQLGDENHEIDYQHGDDSNDYCDGGGDTSSDDCHHDGIDYCDELELNSEGKVIPNGFTGYTLTARAKECRRKKFVLESKSRWATPNLPDAFVVTKHKRPPVLHYGYGLTSKDIMAYATKHNLIKVEYNDPAMSVVAMMHPVVDNLAKVCEANLHFRVPFSVEGHVIMVSLYSNYTMEYEELVDEDEKEVIEILKRELGTEEPPKWYWDAAIPW